MRKLALVTALLLIASMSYGYVIKDTAGPVQIYTGSNTTPTIDAATSGAVTLGPTSSTQAHSINGTLSMSSDLSSAGATGSPILTIDNKRINTGSGAAAIRFRTDEIDDTQRTRAQISAEYDDASNVNGRLLFATTNTSGTLTEVGKVNGTGAWTLGPSTSGAYGTNTNHDINGNILFSGGIGLFARNTPGGGGGTCTSECAGEPTGFNASSGQCMYAWTSGGGASTCGATIVSGFCACIGVQ